MQVWYIQYILNNAIAVALVKQMGKPRVISPSFVTSLYKQISKCQLLILAAKNSLVRDVLSFTQQANDIDELVQERRYVFLALTHRYTITIQWNLSITTT